MTALIGFIVGLLLGAAIGVLAGAALGRHDDRADALVALGWGGASDWTTPHSRSTARVPAAGRTGWRSAWTRTAPC